MGVDAVIAQGGEGGGHTGTVPTSLLLPAGGRRRGRQHPGARRRRVPRRPRPRRRPGLRRRRHRHGHPLPAHPGEPGARRRQAALPRRRASPTPSSPPPSTAPRSGSSTPRSSTASSAARSCCDFPGPRSPRLRFRKETGTSLRRPARARAWPCAAPGPHVEPAGHGGQRAHAHQGDHGRRQARGRHPARPARSSAWSTSCPPSPSCSSASPTRPADAARSSSDGPDVERRTRTPSRRGPGLARGQRPEGARSRCRRHAAEGFAAAPRVGAHACSPTGGRWCRGRPSTAAGAPRCGSGCSSRRSTTGPAGPQRVTQNGIFLLAPSIYEFGNAGAARRDPAAHGRAPRTSGARGGRSPTPASDLASVSSRAREVDGGWVLNGQKTWTTRGAFCTHLFGLFRTDPASERHKGLTYLLVPLDTPGITVRGFGRLDGDEGFAEVFFEDAFLPDDAVPGGVVLGEPEGGWGVGHGHRRLRAGPRRCGRPAASSPPPTGSSPRPLRAPTGRWPTPG